MASTYRTTRLKITNAGRFITENNQQFYVLPAVGVRAPMVLNHLLLPVEELAATAAQWNGVPISIEHHFFGENQLVDNVRRVGQFRNVAIANGDLRGDIYLNLPASESVQNVIDRCEAGETIEVSTGFFANLFDQSGDLNDAHYDHVARNVHPNHLALLPNAIGACSVNHGCGANIAAQQVANLQFEPRGSLERRIRIVRTAIVNEHGPSMEFPNKAYPFVENVFSDFALMDQGDELFKIGYSITTENGTDSVALGAKERVNLNITGVGPMSNEAGTRTFLQNVLQQINQAVARLTRSGEMNRTELVTNVATATGIEAAVLEKWDDSALEKVDNAVKAKAAAAVAPPCERTSLIAKLGIEAAAVENVSIETLRTLVANKPAPPVVAPPPPALTDEQTLALQSVLNTQKAEQAALVAKLVANTNCPFTAEELAGKTVAELTKLENMARPKVYFGQMGMPVENSEPVEDQHSRWSHHISNVS